MERQLSTLFIEKVSAKLTCVSIFNKSTLVMKTDGRTGKQEKVGETSCFLLIHFYWEM